MKMLCFFYDNICPLVVLLLVVENQYIKTTALSDNTSKKLQVITNRAYEQLQKFNRIQIRKFNGIILISCRA